MFISWFSDHSLLPVTSTVDQTSEPCSVCYSGDTGGPSMNHQVFFAFKLLPSQTATAHYVIDSAPVLLEITYLLCMYLGLAHKKQLKGKKKVLRKT